MKAQIVLTSSESKRLIAKAIVRMESVQRALKSGTVVICRGSTNAFIAEEISGQRKEKGGYTAGYIGPKGLSVNHKIPEEVIFVDGKLQENLTLTQVLKDLKQGDLIIKGANAIGPDNIPGLLCARRPSSLGGTLGTFQIPSMTRGIEVIVPVGLEKSIPISVLIGVREVASAKIDYSTGVPCGFIPVFGTVVTEIQAMKILADVDAIPIAAGGIGGAEGSVCLLVKGSDAHVKEIIKIVEDIKGEQPIAEPT